MQITMQFLFNLRFGDLQIPANLVCRELVDLTMPRQAGGFAFGRIAPNSVVATFPQEDTTLLAEMSLQIKPFHASTLTGSRMQSGSRSCSRAKSRFVSNINASASFKLARASSIVAPWVLTPGTSST